MDCSSNRLLTQSSSSYQVQTEGEPKIGIFDKSQRVPDKLLLYKMKLKSNEFQSIINFVDKLNLENEFTIIKRKQSGLSFSLACISKADKVSIFILLKKHRINEIAEGTFSSITSVLDVDSQKRMIFKSAAKKFISENEIQINKILSGRKEFVATDKIFYYEGPVRERDPHECFGENVNNCISFPLSKSYGNNNAHKPAIIEREIREDIPKIGFLMEQLDMSLGAYIETKSSMSLNSFISGAYIQPNCMLHLESFVSIVREMLQNLSVLHNEFNIVHLDIKEDNILVQQDPLTKKLITKIGDFGHSVYAGDPVPLVGSAYYMPPEFINFSETKPRADSSADIWSFGALLIHILNNKTLTRLWEEMVVDMHQPKCKSQEAKCLLVSKFMSRMKKLLNDNDQLLILLPLIERCLVVDPSLRIRADEGVKLLSSLSLEQALLRKVLSY
ncbi:MAG TPA: protein kinase [Parachlamydiaceae bacterium]|nr:protein kinase [Parachlamydiaceae bacterium]